MGRTGERMKIDKDMILLVLATYACIGIFGSMFVFIWEWNTYHSFTISAIMFISGIVVATFNKIYEEMIETPKVRKFVRDNPRIKDMYGKKYQ